MPARPPYRLGTWLNGRIHIGTSRFLTREEVMTAREVADLLRMPTSTVYELARKGVLPASRLGRTWRFLRPRLEELLAR